MHPHLRRAGGQFVQRCSHPGLVRPPEDSMPSPGFFVLSVPCVGEEVLTIHAWYLRVVSVGAQAPEPPRYGPRKRCAGNARLLAAPDRYLAAGSTAASCLLEQTRPSRFEISRRRAQLALHAPAASPASRLGRSEERRVGKEGGSRRWARAEER